MKNLVRDGNTLALAPSGDVVAGKLVVFGDRVLCAQTDIKSGVVGPFLQRGVIKYKKASGDNMSTPGTKLYYNASNDELTVTASTHKLAGYSMSIIGAVAGEVEVDLHP